MRWSVWTLLCLATAGLEAQVTATVQLEAQRQPHAHADTPLEAVFWLQPLDPSNRPAPPLHTGPFTLRQKDRTFIPHILVVPLGATVNFPNDDPFFHNVFSLYQGKRFDLGLYESGTSRQVVFNREGVSYIFCNIHPEMSAVVLALHTPWWARSDKNGLMTITGLPPGQYEEHLWVEGADPGELSRWTHRVLLVEGVPSVATFAFKPAARSAERHLNEFGRPYMPDAPPY